MLLSLSDDLELLKRLETIYFSEGIFSLFANIDGVANFVDSETDMIDFAIVDTGDSIKDARTACDKLRCVFPNVRIGILTHRSALADHVSGISSRSELLSFIAPLIDKKSELSGNHIFEIFPHDTNARLLGYPLKLTKNEHRILLLLASEPERVFSYLDIVRLAFPFSRDLSKNQLAVHICNINKKASMISGRKLILNPHKNGYSLNPHI